MVSFIHVSAHDTLTADIGAVPFAILGYVTFIMFRSMFTRADNILESNAGLLYHRQVTLFDMLLARGLLELASTIVVLAVMIGAATLLGLAALPARPLALIAGIALLWLWSFGLSLLICAGSNENRLLAKFVHPVSYILLPVSRRLLPAGVLPPPFRDWMAAFPMTQMFELIRYGQFEAADARYVDPVYILFPGMIVHPARSVRAASGSRARAYRVGKRDGYADASPPARRGGAPDPARGWRRYRWFAAFVLLPTALAALWLFLFAADQYESEAHFLVRSAELGGGGAVPGIAQMFGLGSGGAGAGEAMSVGDYLLSHDAVRAADERLDLVAHVPPAGGGPARAAVVGRSGSRDAAQTLSPPCRYRLRHRNRHHDAGGAAVPAAGCEGARGDAARARRGAGERAERTRIGGAAGLARQQLVEAEAGWAASPVRSPPIAGSSARSIPPSAAGRKRNSPRG